MHINVVQGKKTSSLILCHFVNNCQSVAKGQWALSSFIFCVRHKNAQKSTKCIATDIYSLDEINWPIYNEVDWLEAICIMLIPYV